MREDEERDKGDKEMNYNVDKNERRDKGDNRDEDERGYKGDLVYK